MDILVEQSIHIFVLYLLLSSLDYR